jgi:hypothetical protein
MNPKATTAFVTLALLSVVYCFLPAKSDPPKSDAFVGLDNFTSEVTPEAVIAAESPENLIRGDSDRTVRYLNGSKGAELKGKNGTVLVFPPNCFVDDEGNTITGRIKIVLDEYYDLTSMLEKNLSTSSGDKLLETAGMVNVKAYANGRNLKLADNTNYQIAFPRNGKAEYDFELFYGAWNDEGVIDWWLAEDDVIESEKGTTTSEATSLNVGSDCFIQITESKLRRGNLISNMDFFNWQLDNGQTLNQWFVGNFNPDLGMLDKYCIENLRTGITFHINRNGEFQDYYISQAGDLESDRMIAGFLSTMPALKMEALMPRYTDDHACMLVFSSKEMSVSENVVADFKRRYSPQKELNGASTAELDYYIFSSTNLGWINCDRFVPEEGELVDLRVKTNAGKDGIVCMVFDDTNSILKAKLEDGWYLFSGVPGSQDVRIIGVDNASGTTAVAVQELNTRNSTIELTGYKNVSLRELDLNFTSRVVNSPVALR